MFFTAIYLKTLLNVVLSLYKLLRTRRFDGKFFERRLNSL